MPTSPTSRRDRWWLTAVVAVISAGLVVAVPSPAGAGFDSTRTRYNVGGSCAPIDVTDSLATGRVYMQELGNSRVRRLKAKFKLYRTNVSYGWNPPYLEKSYSSVEFPNDDKSYYQYLPPNAYHTFQVTGVNSYRLDVKMTWDRAWRRDWTYTQSIAWCGTVNP